MFWICHFKGREADVAGNLCNGKGQNLRNVPNINLSRVLVIEAESPLRITKSISFQKGEWTLNSVGEVKHTFAIWFFFLPLPSTSLFSLSKVENRVSFRYKCVPLSAVGFVYNLCFQHHSKNLNSCNWTSTVKKTWVFDVYMNCCCLLMNCWFCVCVIDPNVYMNWLSGTWQDYLNIMPLKTRHSFYLYWCFFFLALEFVFLFFFLFHLLL